MKNTTAYKTALRCLIIGIFLMALCSTISFDMGDWPSDYIYPHNEPVQNWCGKVGAFASYYMLYFLGPGIFVLHISVLVYLLVRIFGKKVDQLFLRTIGMILLTTVVSASFYATWPDAVYQFPIGSGGLLGVAVISFLMEHFAVLGTFLLVSLTWLVGLVLLADSFAVAGFKYMLSGIGRIFGIFTPAISAAKQHGDVISEIWQKLSAKQKQFDSGSMDFDRDMEIENSFRRNKPVETRSEKQVEQAEPVKGKADELVITSSIPKPKKKKYVPASYEDYLLPPLELLGEPEYGYAAEQSKQVKQKAYALERLLEEFSVNAGIVAADTGPVVTMFELELGAGVKVSQISSLSNDIARALSAGAIRVVAPLPGKHTIGIEVPNAQKEKVRIKELLVQGGERAKKMNIPLFLGKDSAGEALVSDLAAMPHVLIAGTTGSGKSVCINSIIASVLMTKRPDEVKMVLVDPKMVEMTAFNNVPHLMCPIVTETQRAVQILEWATVKMDERYALLAEARVKNIADFNKLSREEIIDRFQPSTQDEEAMIPKRLPYVVIIIDELADLMMTAAKEIESYIVRLAQKSRAVGIHIVLATQRPQATVVTGLIKSNMPCRVGFRVAARMDSRIILDQNGAESLLGEGDMLFLKPGTSDLIRAQGTFMSDDEIRNIVRHLKEIAEPQYHPELAQLGKVDTSEMRRDDMFDDAVEIILETRRGSVSLLQRRLGIGYARASRIIEMMAAAGVLGEYKGSQAREVLMTRNEWENVKKQMAADAAAGFADMRDDDSDDSETHYVTEGQKEYMALEDED